MANTLGPYDPIFYANEAITELRKTLGMAAAVHRGYEKSPQEKGSVISIKQPQSFTAEDMPIATATDLKPGETQMTLDQWKGVVFALTDKDLTLGEERIISDHIQPAAYAIADAIDLSLNGLYADVPWFHDGASPGDVSDFTGVGKILRDNKVPDMQRFLEINSEREADYKGLSTFHEADKAGSQETQVRGTLGTKFGFNIFANQNVQDHTFGDLAADGAFGLNAAYSKGDTQIVITDESGTPAMTGGLKEGDTFVIAGNTQRYAVTADAASDGGADTITVNIFPALVQDYASGADVTFDSMSGANKAANLAFHRAAFALAMAPLSDAANRLANVNIASVADPVTNLAIRSRIWYEGKESATYIGLDALWGVKTLDPNKAVRLHS